MRTRGEREAMFGSAADGDAGPASTATDGKAQTPAFDDLDQAQAAVKQSRSSTSSGSSFKRALRLSANTARSLRMVKRRALLDRTD